MCSSNLGDCEAEYCNAEMVRARLQTSIPRTFNFSSMQPKIWIHMLAGIVMYEVIGDKKLLDVGQSIYDYRSKIAAFQQVDLSAVPYELQTLLGPMLSVTPAARPSAISITGSKYFQVRSKHL